MAEKMVQIIAQEIVDNLIIGVSLFVLGNHWLPLATFDLVGDNREFEV